MVTGGAGFIGSNLVRLVIQDTKHSIVNIDKLTYAGNLASLRDIESSDRYEFERMDITDPDAINDAFQRHSPDWVINLAAETHVDRSIDGPGAFIQTNVVGTYNMLTCASFYWKTLTDDRKSRFRFHHVSTDEVYGSLKLEDSGFSESTKYDPHSPYSASKASADHLVRAWFDTYGLPVLITNCSNNYGPFQFPEKLIPVVILKAIHGESIPVYGKGKNVRDWLFVMDHAKAILLVLESGRVGESYNVGGDNELRNIDLVRSLCTILDKQAPIKENPNLDEAKKSKLNSYADLITYVTDRPGHDLRYAINATKIQNELGWSPKEDPVSGFEKTVYWYLNNRKWWSKLFPNHEIRGVMPSSEATG